MDQDTMLLVIWHDAYSTYGWRRPSEVEGQTMEVHSLGWFIRKTKTKLVIAMSRSSNGDYAEYLTIPKSWITKTLIVSRRRK